MSDDFWVELGRKLVSIRSSDAFDVADTASLAAASYEKGVSSGRKDSQAISTLLCQMEDVGLVKRGTIFNTQQQREGYHGLWDASLFVLEKLNAAMSCPSSELATVSYWFEEIRQLSDRMPNGASWPPTIRMLQRNLADLRQWQKVLVEQINEVQCQLFHMQKQLRTALQPVSTSLWNPPPPPLVSSGFGLPPISPPSPLPPPPPAGFASMAIPPAAIASRLYHPCVNPNCACSQPGGSSWDGQAGKHCCKSCRMGDPCTKLWHTAPVAVRKAAAYALWLCKEIRSLETRLHG